MARAEAQAVRRLETIMGTGVEQLAATGTYDEAPEARNSRRNSRDAKGCVLSAMKGPHPTHYHDRKTL